MERGISIAACAQFRRVDQAARLAIGMLRDGQSGESVSASVELLADEIGSTRDEVMERAIEITEGGGRG